MSRTRDGADADKHLDEVRAADGEEWNVRFAGDGPREQRLSSAGRADQQHAFGNAAAEFLEFFRVAQELDEFLHFILGFLDAGDVLERDLVLIARQHARLRLAEIQRTLAGHADLLAEKEIKHEEEKRDRQKADQRLRHQHSTRVLIAGWIPAVARRSCRLVL